ncbi:hypothetical protein [Aliikangiella sp. IMCC44359]|uniref:hypothetical protein n=1 Tax=Aliikangiella sp. IMCC44359 TaxID=3459125 RepID=UPI00403AAE15
MFNHRIFSQLAFFVTLCFFAFIPSTDADAPYLQTQTKNQSLCSASATCEDGTKLFCQGSSVCSNQDQNCSNNIRGRVTCDGQTQECKKSCPAPPKSVTGKLICNTFGRETGCSFSHSNGVMCSKPKWSLQGTSYYWHADGNIAELIVPSNCSGNTISVRVSCQNGNVSKYKNIPCDPDDGPQ